MAMRTPEELAGICKVFYAELHSLGFDEIRNAMINIYNDEKETFVNYDCSDEIGKSINHLTYDIHPEIKKQIKQIRSAGDAFSETYFKGKDLEDLKAFGKEIGEKGNPRIDNTDALYYYFYSIGTRSIGISTFNFIAGEKLEVFKRFRNVFTLTYQRYTDIAQAEAQARKVQIELALEKVRSRAMAMQNSNELAVIVDAVFKELTKLNVLLNRCIIMIYDLKTLGSLWWLANPEPALAPVGFLVKYHEYKPYLDYIKAWKERTLKWEYVLEGTDKKEWDEFVFAETELSLLPAAVIAGMKSFDRIFLNVSFNNFGSLTASGVARIQEEHFDILLRFAKVFDSTYSHFNDLQKAEAQAREAKIETALERVRSKTMTMQDSNDVGETAATLFDELSALGLLSSLDLCGIGTMQPNEIMELWTAGEATGKTDLTIGHLDMRHHTLLKNVYQNWLDKKETYQYILKGNDRLEYYEAMRNQANYKIKKDYYSSQERIVHTDFFFNEGALYKFSKNEFAAHATSIFIRLANVFGQSYRRYLDLQKAEAQGREAKIEAALERVRCPTLAMQKSDELAETAAVLFKQLILLGIEPNHLYTNIIKNETGESEFWITDEDGSQVSSAFELSMDDNPSFKKMFTGWIEKKKSLVIDMSGKELKEYFQHLGNLNVHFKEGLTQKRRLQYIAYFNKGFIGMASPDEQP